MVILVNCPSGMQLLWCSSFASMLLHLHGLGVLLAGWCLVKFSHSKFDQLLKVSTCQWTWFSHLLLLKPSYKCYATWSSAYSFSLPSLCWWWPYLCTSSCLRQRVYQLKRWAGYGSPTGTGLDSWLRSTMERWRCPREGPSKMCDWIFGPTHTLVLFLV